MKKKLVVISLGGSQIIPNKINYFYLKSFKEIILKNKDYRFVIVCGGGSLAREYIGAIKKEKGDLRYQSFAGINATRANARFISYFFGFDPEWGIPHKMRTLRKYLRKRDLVICGALEYSLNQTSDSTAANIARKLGGIFINLTNVKGLYEKDPNKFKNSKLISKISWKDFDELVQKINFKPGQHFVLDQTASKIILKNRIPTYIIRDLSELNSFFRNGRFLGTRIEG